MPSCLLVDKDIPEQEDTHELDQHFSVLILCHHRDFNIVVFAFSHLAPFLLVVSTCEFEIVLTFECCLASCLDIYFPRRKSHIVTRISGKKCQVPKGDDVLPHPICMYILYSTVCWCQSTIIEERNEKHNVKVTRVRLQQGTHTIITFEKFVKEMGKEKKNRKMKLIESRVGRKNHVWVDQSLHAHGEKIKN